MKQEHDADERDDDALFEECGFERVDRRMDEVRPVIDWDDLGPGRQAWLHFGETSLDVVDHVESVHARPLQSDPARNLAIAVQFGDAASLIRTQLDISDIRQAQRRSLVGAQDDLSEILDTSDVATPSHHEFEFRELDRATPDVHVAL